MELLSSHLQNRRAITLASRYVIEHGYAATEDAIRRVVRSVKFVISKDENAFYLMGPDMSYHYVDPYLPAELKRMGIGITSADILSFCSSERSFDLCLEDSWTGYFMAKSFEQNGQPDEFVLIHLDDHADMMPTLLYWGDGEMTDPTTGRLFNPSSSNDWRSVIESGAINIGNYITPYYFTNARVHVRHINNSSDESELMSVSRSPCRYNEIPSRLFADIRKSIPVTTSDGNGTCITGVDPALVLAELPVARTLVHIDLDYFINDFNGNSWGTNYVPSASLNTIAMMKMDTFFAALLATKRHIDRWIVGTSPGFCSAFHWKWLLDALDQRIIEFSARRESS